MTQSFPDKCDATCPSGSANSIDWCEEWRRAQPQRRKQNDAAYWDRRARGYAPAPPDDDYTQAFLTLAGIRGGERVLDMGCGGGALALRLAQDGHEVYAVDFSPATIDFLCEQARIQQLAGLKPLVASWEDDWTACGIPEVDVALASRSVAMSDLGLELAKLNAVARRRVCLTISVNDSPRYDRVLHEAIGRTSMPNPDYTFCLNILRQRGIEPQVRFIDSVKDTHYRSYEDARCCILDVFETLTPHETELLEHYFAEHLICVMGETCDGSIGEVWKKDYTQSIRWAHISWDK